MKIKGSVVVLLSWMLLCMPVTPVEASAAAGRMITKGNAEINGIAAPAVTSVFVGDRIATETGTITSLSFSGGNAVTMPGLTKAALGEREGHFVVTLEDGTVSILNKSGSPIVVEALGARIETASNLPALFDVTLHGNALSVVSRGGTARVVTANRTGEVAAGKALNATLAPAPAAKPQLANSSAGTWLIIGGAAAGGAGAGMGAYAVTHRNNNCVLSPSTNEIQCN